MSYTKGEWAKSVSFKSGEKRHFHIVANDKKVVASTAIHKMHGLEPPEEEIEANARLIAAAPDLLEACKKAKKLFPDFIVGDVAEYAEIKDIRDSIKQALAKAEPA